MLNLKTVTLEDLQAALRAGGSTPSQAAKVVSFELFYRHDTHFVVLKCELMDFSRRDVRLSMSTSGRLTAVFL